MTLSYFTRAVKYRNVAVLSYPRVDRLDKKRPRGSLGRFLHAVERLVNNEDSMKEARQWKIIVQRGRPCERNPSETMNVLVSSNSTWAVIVVSKLSSRVIANVTICEQDTIKVRYPRLREENKS